MPLECMTPAHPCFDDPSCYGNASDGTRTWNQQSSPYPINFCAGVTWDGTTLRTQMPYFSVGDRMLLVIMQSDNADTSGAANLTDAQLGPVGLWHMGRLTSYENTFGTWEATVEPAPSPTFLQYLDGTNPAQLCNVPEYSELTLDTDLEAAPYTPPYGGVVAFFTRRLIHNGRAVSANGAGYRGAGDNALAMSFCGTPTMNGEGLGSESHNQSSATRSTVGGGGGALDVGGGGGGGNQTAGGNGGKNNCQPDVTAQGGASASPATFRLLLGGGGGTG
ncbi:MAG: hypothetical protein AB2A00_26440, partial [Myxococcota bacterium]